MDGEQKSKFRLSSRACTCLLLLSVIAACISLLLPRACFQSHRVSPDFVRTPFFLLSGIALFLRVRCVPRARWASSRFIDAAPFLAGALLMAYTLTSRYDNYDYGLDSAFYYSYLPSVVLDHDLNLTNQYRASGLDQGPTQALFTDPTSTGHAPNVFPIGTAVVWLPFFLAGHFVAWTFHQVGIAVSTDGYSITYVRALQMGQVLLVFAGLHACFLFLRRHFTRFVSYVAVLGIWLGSPLLFYSTGFRLTSEAPSVFVVSVLFLTARRWVEKPSRGLAIATGLLAGLSILIRLQHAILVAAVAIPLGLISWKERRSAESRRLRAAGLLLMSLSAIMVFAPQLVTWRILFGEWLPHLADFAPNWAHPYLLESLFSTRKGLFTWSPLLVLAVAGLWGVLRRDRTWGVAAAVALGIGIYLNASQTDFWAGAGFGSRRFVSYALIFGLGLGAALQWLMARCSGGRVGVACVVILTAFLASFEIPLCLSFQAGEIDRHEPIVMNDAMHHTAGLYSAVFYATQFPVQLYYHLRYRFPMYTRESELLIGGEVVHYEEITGGSLIGPGEPLFGRGWSNDLVVFDGAPARRMLPQGGTLNLPLFYLERPGIFVDLTLATDNQKDVVAVDLLLNGAPLQTVVLRQRQQRFSVLLRVSDCNSGVNEVAVSARSRDHPRVAPSLYLTEIHFRKTREGAENHRWWQGDS